MQRIPLLLLILILAGAPPLASQLSVQGIRDLQFGTVMAGVPGQVQPTDPLKAGEFQFATRRNTWILLFFALPTQLNGPGTATMPIQFGNGDALYIGGDPGTTPFTFNPQVWRFMRTDPTGRGRIFLGGQVNPTPLQPAGSYTNTVTLTVWVIG